VRNEVLLMKKCESEFIVPIKDFFLDQNRKVAYIVMPKYDSNLQKYYDKQSIKITEKDNFDIILQLTKILQFIHSQGLILLILFKIYKLHIFYNDDNDTY